MRGLPLNVLFRAIRGDLKLSHQEPRNELVRSGVQVVSTEGDKSQNWHSMLSSKKKPQIAKPAFCETELTTIELDIEKKDPNSFYYPTCVRVERCNGCCSHNLLSCQAKESGTIDITIMRANQRTNSVEYLKIPVIQHKTCSCDCIVKEEDCLSNQVYKRSDCRCACKATDTEKLECISQGNRIWNPHKCFCQCLVVFECTTGQSFDMKSCNCKDRHDFKN
uniref:Vascular endothelial growth factor toxin n=3 Tax=Lepeophtheirus salmonis TaxID=72036 RepID=D3PGW5_LEPSM|nr:Vascular endothelial growth factor toxin [Lepeophtheirus salmonis]